MFTKKMLVSLLLFVAFIGLVYAEEHASAPELVPAEESPFAYRKGPAISLGAGWAFMYIRDENVLTSI